MRLTILAAAVLLTACAAPEAVPVGDLAPAAATAPASAAAPAAAPSGAAAPPAPAVTGSGAVATAADLPSPVSPFPKGLRGELVFQSDREGPTRIYVLDLASGAVRRVGSTGDWFDEEPRWSLDGQRIAFSSTRGQKGNRDIFVMNADGSDIQRITDHRADELSPVWAADGQSLFFTGERDGRGEIYRVWLKDRRVERVTAGIDRAIMPAVSPDGRYLAYAGQTIMYFQIHLMDLTNGTTRQVSSGGGSCRPSFAPDSQELAFVRIDKEPSQIDAARETGTRVLIQDPKLWSYYPDYSPDGKQIAFSVSPEHHEGEDWDLALMDVAKPGSFIRLTVGAGNDRVPDWKPAR